MTAEVVPFLFLFLRPLLQVLPFWFPLDPSRIGLFRDSRICANIRALSTPGFRETKSFLPTPFPFESSPYLLSPFVFLFEYPGYNSFFFSNFFSPPSKSPHGFFLFPLSHSSPVSPLPNPVGTELWPSSASGTPRLGPGTPPVTYPLRGPGE